MGRIYTIGYEGRTPEDFVGTLKKANVSIVIDIRENASSRKKGFSKKALAAILADNGIKYEHMIHLGTPKDIRIEYKASGDIGYLMEHYRQYLSENPDYIADLVNIIEENQTCLMCFEKLPTECHRIILAEYLYLNQGMAINHL